MSVAFFYAAKADKTDRRGRVGRLERASSSCLTAVPPRMRLYTLLNALPTVYEELYSATFGSARERGGKKKARGLVSVPSRRLTRLLPALAGASRSCCEAGATGARGAPVPYRTFQLHFQLC